MQKLFLASLFKDVSHLLKAFAGEGLKGKTVTFIPTAAFPDKLAFHVWHSKRVLAKMGLAVDELELSAASHAEITGKLEKNDYIYVTGGNTFYLLQEMNSSGAGAVIKEQVESGKLFIGEFAGAIAAAPNIAYSKAMDNPLAAPGLCSFDALNLVDFYPVPHYKNFPLKKAAEKIISRYHMELPLVPFRNSQAILVTGKEMRVVS